MDLVDRLRAGHRPAPAQLDQTAGPTGGVCVGHGLGYPPPWPCLAVEAADEIEALYRAVRDLSDLHISGPGTVENAYTLEAIGDGQMADAVTRALAWRGD